MSISRSAQSSSNIVTALDYPERFLHRTETKHKTLFQTAREKNQGCRYRRSKSVANVDFRAQWQNQQQKRKQGPRRRWVTDWWDGSSYGSIYHAIRCDGTDSRRNNEGKNSHDDEVDYQYHQRYYCRCYTNLISIWEETYISANLPLIGGNSYRFCPTGSFGLASGTYWW